MKSLFVLTLLALNLAGTQAAGYSLKVHNGGSYSGRAYECFSSLPRKSLCCDWSQTVINDDLRSFRFSTSSNCGVILYKDWKCSGDNLGSSSGSWSKESVSDTGRQASSAHIWCN
ncbi:hypothetical protein BGZ95_005525 [Linnemannia exigua]|uniref:Uncharacterized protein n=1 Tax=Linnemannia exigua TaxID=604196 RepID=A0AAD4D1T6_9FUNG|nr:hypothetical protein BGZ95_005525 [Linnemannia exigua]